jgi:hypothetical protein
MPKGVYKRTKKILRNPVTQETKDKISNTLLHTKLPLPKKEIISLYKDGFSKLYISKKLNLAPPTISKLLTLNNINIRGIKEQRILNLKNGRTIIKKGKEHHSWKGGIHICKNAKGYIVHSILHQNGKRKTYFEHRLIWEQHHGKIPETHSIHHLNGIKDDNRIENLISLHKKIHKWDTVLVPYRNKIKELERQLKKYRRIYGTTKSIRGNLKQNTPT